MAGQNHSEQRPSPTPDGHFWQPRKGTHKPMILTTILTTRVTTASDNWRHSTDNGGQFFSALRHAPVARESHSLVF